MLGPAQLAGLLATETDRIEWKQSTRQPDKLLQAVCALANDLGDSGTPGFLVIGLDNNGRVRGIDEDGNVDQQQQALASRVRSSQLQPVPSVSITDATIDGKTLLVVEVTPHPVPPVVEFDGRPWVRLGTTTRLAVHADLLRLNERRPAHRQPFDTRPRPDASIDDLEVAALRKRFDDERDADDHVDSFPSFEKWLEGRQYGVLQANRFVPNTASILTLGKSPQDLLPGAWVDLVRYEGLDRDGAVVSRRQATGTLADQLDVGWTWLAANIASHPAEAAGIRAGFVPDYPAEALKELLRNLVQHRLYEGTNAPGRVEWFADRIEFSNPGGPFGRAADGEFGSHSDYRNTLVTKRLTDTGHVQQLGRGVQRTRLQLEKNGNPPLEVESDGFTRVVVRRRP